MDHAGGNTPLPKRLLVALPALHVALFTITTITGERTASGGNPLICVEIPVSLPLVATDRLPVVLVVGILATVWWYFIAQVGWSSASNRISRVMATLGALLVMLICLADATLMFSEFRCCISKEPSFSAIDGVIYILAVVLLCGGLVSAAFSARAALGLNRG